MTPWTVANFPYEPRDEPGVLEVPGALLTKVERGPLRLYGRPDRFIKGAVYDARRRLVVESQKAAVPSYPWVAADPGNLGNAARVRETLAGRWLYGGHWMDHFGHFMIETLPALWPGVLSHGGSDGASKVSDLDGLVFHTYHRGRSVVEPWQQRSLDLVGLGGLPIRVIGKAPGLLEVEHLVLGGRPVVMEGWGHPQARAVWRTVSSQFASSTAPRNVYLSKTQFNARRRADESSRVRRQPRTTPSRDYELDQLFEESGFEVIAPETLPIDEQFRLFSNAGVLAACSGSALHMSAFAPQGGKVLEIGDSNNPQHPQPTQLLIDTLCDHQRWFAPATATAEEIREVAAMV